MSFKKSIAIITISLAFLVSGRSQDWKADLKALNQAYADAQTFQMDIVIETYAKKEDLRPMMTANGKVMYDNGKSYSEMMGKITLMNEKCILMIDLSQKIILYAANTANYNGLPRKSSLIYLDSLIILYESNVNGSYLTNTSDERRINLKYYTGPIDRIELELNPLNNTLTEMVYFYKVQSPGNTSSVEKIVIKFMHVELNNIIDSAAFNESEFIRVENNVIRPTNKYSSFQVLNQGHIQYQ